MAQAKKKKSTKTTKKTTKCGCKKAACKKTISSRERAHVCFVAALSIIAGILLCADAAFMIVS